MKTYPTTKGTLFHNVFFLFNNVHGCQHDIKAGKPVWWAHCTQPGSQGQTIPPILRSAGAVRDRSFRPHFLCPTAGRAGRAGLSPACYPSLYKDLTATDIPTEKAHSTHRYRTGQHLNAKHACQQPRAWQTVLFQNMQRRQVTQNHSLFYELHIAFLLFKDWSKVTWREIFC